MSIDLFLDEKRFISVSRASKETGYSQDYIGQLCRQKKLPAKLIGRAWFVDLDSLIKHKKGVYEKNTQKPKHLGLKQALVLPISAEKTFSERIENGEKQFLPEIKKSGSNVKPEARPIIKNKFVYSSALIIGVFVLANIAFSWIQFASPQFASDYETKLVSAYKTALSSLLSVGDNFSLAQVMESFAGSNAPAGDQGIVTFPNSAGREETTNRIKNSFSDDVEIFFDQGGESGIIRPVFKSTNDEEDYAFVLVPINRK